MKSLKIDPRGFPVPWFTPWDREKGEWNFQAIDPRRIRLAVERDTCWICGQKLFANKAFVIGPMCAINRITQEPPSHVECATFAAQACPFLSRPRMRRAPITPEGRNVPGIMIERNPGVCLVWITRAYRQIPVHNGILIQVADPVRVEAYCQGRRATPIEIIESITSGLPELIQVDKGDPAAIEEIKVRLIQAWLDLNLPGSPADHEAVFHQERSQ
jgi:hypothetical protein